MQDESHDWPLANQMDCSPPLSQSSYPAGFEGEVAVGLNTTGIENHDQYSPLQPRGGSKDWLLIDAQGYPSSNSSGIIGDHATVGGFFCTPSDFNKEQPTLTPPEAFCSIHDSYRIQSSLFNESVLENPWTALPVTSPSQLGTCSNFAEPFPPLNGYVGPKLETPSHVFGLPLMNGGLLPPTDFFQFADDGKIGHELSFPEQSPEATSMQGQPDGSNVWDSSGLANAAAPYNGQASNPPYAANAVPQWPDVFLCHYPTCRQTFKRDTDRSRHEQSVHFNNPGLHLCPIAGCPKSYGKGYSRPDKVTEHLWRKHANLGFTKA
ncbi:hypothetical protein NA56DRAFT_242173 [Hyaloscypha hepaticicola]|uniref:C2H2-type domain-containing protein n=1 Tax=Hyaloscypha hepaticicola TaxID=2082293 RepID=A0A2J6PXC1_9HELO|nr:hypothetical protein NA56DRAFT_242173 [Hyaloscypha hepaticicola]